MSTKKRPNAFSTRRELASLQEIPNIGPSLAESLERAGIKRPSQLKGKDPYVLYARLCERTRVRHDPCVLDTFISAVRYMEGGPVQPWWHFTRERRENQALCCADPSPYNQEARRGGGSVESTGP
jgi:hypothetical protein